MINFIKKVIIFSINHNKSSHTWMPIIIETILVSLQILILIIYQLFKPMNKSQFVFSIEFFRFYIRFFIFFFELNLMRIESRDCWNQNLQFKFFFFSKLFILLWIIFQFASTSNSNLMLNLNITCDFLYWSTCKNVLFHFCHFFYNLEFPLFLHFFF